MVLRIPTLRGDYYSHSRNVVAELVHVPARLQAPTRRVLTPAAHFSKPSRSLYPVPSRLEWQGYFEIPVFL